MAKRISLTAALALTCFASSLGWAGVGNEHLARCTVISFNAKKAKFRCEGFKYRVLLDRDELDPTVDQKLRVDGKVQLLVDFNQFKKWAAR